MTDCNCHDHICDECGRSVGENGKMYCHLCTSKAIDKIVDALTSNGVGS